MQKSVMGQDHLAENLIDGYQPMASGFPDESILKIETEEEHPTWIMYFEGAANVPKNGIGAILISPTGAHSQWPQS